MKRKFKIGDKVIHNPKGHGIIRSIDKDDVPYGVEFEDITYCNARGCKENYGYWCHETFLTKA
jgi:hypothetical protein